MLIGWLGLIVSSGQKPHFSRRTREMGHPSRLRAGLAHRALKSKTPLLAKNARNGAPSRLRAGLAHRALKSRTPLLAKNARNGAPGLAWAHRELRSKTPLLAKNARNGAPKFNPHLIQI